MQKQTTHKDTRVCGGMVYWEKELSVFVEAIRDLI